MTGSPPGATPGTTPGATGPSRPLPRLIALSPGTLRADGLERFARAVAAAVGAGLPALLVRERALPDRALFALLRELRRAGPPWLGCHDRVHLALAAGCDAVHLGFRSLAAADARRIATRVGPPLAIGLSTHADDDPAAWDGASYLVHGPVRATPSKRGLREPIGTAGLERAVGRAAVPLLAIGGLGPDDVRPVLATGAHGLVVLRGILASEDPARATERYLRALAA